MSLNNVFISQGKKNYYSQQMNNLNFVKQKYYLKKTFYGGYVKNVVLPLDLINSNIGNKDGVKNTGKNKTKLYNSRIRTHGNFIRKAYTNFWNQKDLSFLTLTYAKNEDDVKKCKYDLKKFFQNVNRWYNSPKCSKRYTGPLKYTYTYEYQKRGAVHFHIILNKHIPNSVVLQYWPYGFNKNIKARKGTNEDIVKYIGKYIIKDSSNNPIKSKNNFDLNIKAYQFSSNCVKPKTTVGVIELCLEDLVYSMGFSENAFTFGKNGKLCGISIDTYLGLDPFRQYQKYRSQEQKIFMSRFYNNLFKKRLQNKNVLNYNYKNYNYNSKHLKN